MENIKNIKNMIKFYRIFCIKNGIKRKFEEYTPFIRHLKSVFGCYRKQTTNNGDRGTFLIYDERIISECGHFSGFTIDNICIKCL